ncbi:hypothetical protein ACWE42_16830 [Sutcliffiella cohnii]
MFTDEQMELFKRLAEAYGKLIEAAAKTMAERLEQAILYFDEINKVSYEEPIHPAARNAHLGNPFMKQQVIMRKPLFVRARSSC